MLIPYLTDRRKSLEKALQQPDLVDDTTAHLDVEEQLARIDAMLTEAKALRQLMEARMTSFLKSGVEIRFNDLKFAVRANYLPGDNNNELFAFEISEDDTLPATPTFRVPFAPAPIASLISKVDGAVLERERAATRREAMAAE